MTEALLIALPALGAAMLAFVLAPLTARIAGRIGAVDLPGDRKIHATAIPRLGGVAVVTSIGLVLGISPWLSGGRLQLPLHLLTPLVLGLFPIFVVSVLDDINSVGARKKLIAHTIGAIAAVSLGISLAPVVHLFGVPIDIGLMALPLSVVWIVGVTNAFNIIDGLDGLSAGLAFISAISMAAVFVLVGELQMAGVVLILAGALAGFLPYNVHPARMFLGDSGATAIGFCLAAFALRGGSTLTSGFAALIPIFILGLPIADTLITVARRTLRRFENPAGGMFVPDRDHLHHRLLALGIDHGRAVLILYGAGAVLATAAFVSVFLNARQAGLFVVALLLAGFVGVHRLGYDEFAFIRRGTMLKVYEVPAIKRGMFVVFVDIMLAVVCAYLALGLKSDDWTSPSIRHAVLNLATTFAPVTVLIFWRLGMYRGSWRVAGLQDLVRACTSVLVATVAAALVLSVLFSDGYPLSLLIIYGSVSLILTASVRASYAILDAARLRASHHGVPVLIYGAGSSGVAAVEELFRNASAGLKPIGFIDDDVRMRGRLVSGLPVFGTAQELDGILLTCGAKALLVPTQTISAERVARALDRCDRAGVSFFRLNIQVERLGAEREGGMPPPSLQPTMSAFSRSQSTTEFEPTSSIAAEACPSCAGREIRRSKARSLYEKLWKAHTPTRLFRCSSCGWRGWLTPIESGTAAFKLQLESLDLSLIDETSHRTHLADRAADY